MKQQNVLQQVVYSALLCSMFIVGVAHGQAPCVKHTSTPGALSITQVLASVNCYYPQIRVARLQIARTRGDYLQTLGQFDPSLNTSTQSLPAGGYISNYIDNEVRLPTFFNGVQLYAGYRNGQGSWPVYYQNYLTNSGGEYRAGLTLPLLRDRRIDKPRTEVLSAAQQVQVAQQQAKATKVKIYQEAIRAYWQWVQIGLQYQEFKRLLKLANVRQAAIVKQANTGAIPKLTIIENRQLIMQRQQLVVQSQMQLAQAAVALSLYYRNSEGKPMLPQRTQLPKRRELVNTPSGEPYADAFMKLEKHPAIDSIRQYEKIVRLRRDLARNDLQPNLNLESYTMKQYGVDGYPLLIPQAAFIGVNFKFPVLLREAKGRLISSSSELRQVNQEKRFIRDQLRNHLKTLFITERTLKKQRTYIKNELSYAKRVAHAESVKFYAGDSTLFLVNQREQIVTQIVINLIATEVNLQQTKQAMQYFSTA